jgi:2-polyprenyl-3-methyl-5-hydroxy-6-metoxy-1,4-benzoquinol methylase
MERTAAALRRRLHRLEKRRESLQRESGEEPHCDCADPVDSFYFDSYGKIGIHEVMLKDECRTRAYMDAICTDANREKFKGKVVLDIGCGTGILSLFAARAGAKLVIGVDASDIIKQARRVVSANGFDGVIKLIGGKIEEVELPVQQVDIIVSEWMGYFLVFESMLESVLFARDKWLRPGGLIYPDKFTMNIAAIEGGELKDKNINFWHNVCGFDMSVMKEDAINEPLCTILHAQCVVSDAVQLGGELDVMTLPKGLGSCSRALIPQNDDEYGENDDEYGESGTGNGGAKDPWIPFSMTAARHDFVHGFAVFFDCIFR